MLYERFAVPEYWIVDPVKEVIRVFRLAEAQYAVTAELQRGRRDVLTTPLMPGLELALDEIFVD